MTKLRSYQTDAFKTCVNFFEEKKAKPSVLTLPTAWGKSHLIAAVADHLSQQGSRVLSLQPSKELLEQNLGKYQAIADNAKVYSASMKTKEIGDVTFATLGSIKKMGYEFHRMGFDKLIIDECHLYSRNEDGMLNKFVSEANFKHIIGLTATPLKLQSGLTEWPSGETYSKLVMLTSRTKTVNFFKRMLYVSQIRDLVRDGAWSRIEYETYDFLNDRLHFNTTKSDYTEASINAVYKEDNLHDKIRFKLEEIVERKSIVVFVPAVSQAQELALSIPNSSCIYSGMPDKERTKIIRDFKSLKIRVLVNVGIVAIGFDHPRMDAIIMARPTASLSLYYQVAGRLTRPHPEKEDALFVDFAGNVSRFGMIEDLFFSEQSGKWELYGKGGLQLTGIPMHRIGEKFIHVSGVTEKHSDGILKFGRYKDQHITEVPDSYIVWMITDGFNFGSNTALKKLVQQEYEKRVVMI